MSNLGDDELGLILEWIDDPDDRKSFSLVCKQWLRVEGQIRLSIRVLELDLLYSFLPRFPNIVTFESPVLITDAHIRFIAQMCPKLEILNLNFGKTSSFHRFEPSGSIYGFDDFGNDGILALVNGRCELSKVFLRRRKNIGNYGVVSLVEAMRNLTHLDLGRCILINDESLVAIGNLNSIEVLNLEGCSLITDRGLASLANGSPSRTLKKLVLADCDRITDSGVSLLQHIHCLEGLNLAECGPQVTDFGIMALASIQTLKRLNLSWLINVSDITLVALAENCRDLVALDLTGCELITGAGIRAFAFHECLEAIVLASCYNICGDDLDLLVRCKSLRSIVLDKGLRMWITTALHDNIGRFCELHWR